MGVAETIRRKLTEGLAPSEIEVFDESEQHRGHGGWREGGETHFRVRLKSASFNDLSRVQRQRAVHALLKEELAGPVHALALELSAETG